MTARTGISNTGNAGTRDPSNSNGFSGEQDEGRPLGNNFAKWSTAEKIIERDHNLLVRLSKA